MLKRRPRVEDPSATSHQPSSPKRVRGRLAFFLALSVLAALALWTPLSSGSGARPAQPQSNGPEKSARPAPSTGQKKPSAVVARNPPAPKAAPSLKTDSGFYLPGEEITLTGMNWSPGETVTIVISEGAEAKKGVTLEATADEDGAFTVTSPMPEVRAAIGAARTAKSERERER